MMNEHEFVQWSQLELGTAKLCDGRRTQRLVEIAAEAAEYPAGRITAVFENEAEREAAYRLDDPCIA